MSGACKIGVNATSLLHIEISLNTKPTSKIRILHVDDDPCILEVAKQILELEGDFEVDNALSVDEAVKKMNTQSYDAIASDYEMPQKNGLDFLKELRQTKNEIPFVLFTGKGREEVAIQALNLGANGYYNKQGTPETVYGELAHGIQLIVAHKKTEVELNQKNEILKRVGDSIDAGLAVIGRDYRVVWVNKRLKDLGIAPNKKCYETHNKLGIVCPDCGVEKIFEQNVPLDVHEYKTVNSKGETTWVELRVTPIKDKDGNVTTALELVVPITERKKAEEKLLASEKTQRELVTELQKAEAHLRAERDRAATYLDTAGVMLVALDTQGRITMLNLKGSEILGVTAEEALGQNAFDTVPEENRDSERKHFQLIVAGKVLPRYHEFPVLSKNGERRMIAWYHTVMRNPDGQITGVLSSGEDITERKKVEEALRESEEKYRTQFEETMDGIVLVDAETGIIVDCNRAIAKLVGRPKSELVGKHQRTLHPPEEAEGEFSRTFKQHLKEKEGQVLEAQVITKNGKLRDVAIKANAFELAGRRVLQGIFRDITEQKKVEKALREVEEKYRETIVTANVGIIAYDPKGEVKILNPKMEEMTGFTSREIPTLTKWFEKLYPNEEERRKVRDKWFKRMSEEGEVKEGHAIITTKDGKRRNFLFNGFQLKSGDFIAFAQDITERKEAEEKLDKLMNELVLVNEKLGVVGSLTRHDVRNKLCAVTGNVYLLKKKYVDQADIIEGLGKMEQAVKDSVKIFDFAKMYEQLGVEELKYVDAEKTINEAMALFSDSFSLEVINDCHGLTLLADSLLRQLFYNLIDNSLKHGENVTKIRVHYEKVDQDKLIVVYEDDGIGISAVNKQQLFKEGFSTSGTSGYGLFLIQKMMEVYGWRIQEAGEPGKSAKFTITIPRINQNGKESFQITS
jgi:PAS domain S-box-containing protein